MNHQELGANLPPSEEKGDEDIVALGALPRGDPRLHGHFRKIEEKYRRRILSYILRKGLNRDEADEVMQRVRLKIFKYAHSYNPEYSGGQWISSIAANVIKVFLEQKSKAALVTSFGDEQSNGADIIAVKEESGRTPADVQAVQKLVHAAIDSLEPLDALLVRLRDLDGLDIDQIIANPDVLAQWSEKAPNRNSVSIRITKARHRLRNILLEELEADPNILL